MFFVVLCKHGKTLVDWRMAIHGTSDRFDQLMSRNIGKW